MSVYHLHARLIEGTLEEPVRNELRTFESDDFVTITAQAEDYAGSGYSVWIYDHSPHPMPNGEGSYRVIAEWGHGGTRRR